MRAASELWNIMNNDGIRNVRKIVEWRIYMNGNYHSLWRVLRLGTELSCDCPKWSPTESNLRYLTNLVKEAIHNKNNDLTKL